MPRQLCRTPGKAKLGAEISLLGIEHSAADAHLEAGKFVGAAAQHYIAQPAVFFTGATKVLPPHAQGQSQVRLHLVVVLDEQPHQVLAQVLAQCGRPTGDGIELGVFRTRSIVQEIPHVVEVVAGAVRPVGGVHKEQAGEFAAHLQGVSAVNLGQHILAGVSPLVETVERPDPKSFDTGSADRGVTDRRQTIRSVWILCQIFLRPAGGVETRLIRHTPVKSMVIEQSCSLVLVFRVENVHGPVAVAVQVGVAGGHPVETGGDKVFAGGVEIDAPVVLVFAVCVGLVRAHNEGDVGGRRVEIIRPTEAVSSSTWTQIAEP